MASIYQLLECIDLKNWREAHGTIIADYSKTTTDEYNAVVEELLNRITECSPLEFKRFRKIYYKDIYYRSPTLMTDVEFNKIIDEFIEGNFENLEKLKIFLTTSARILHIFDVWDDCQIFVSCCERFRQDPDDGMAHLSIQRLILGRGINEDVEAMREQIRAGNYTDVDEKIKKYKTLRDESHQLYIELLKNIPPILTLSENPALVDIGE